MGSGPCKTCGRIVASGVYARCPFCGQNDPVESGPMPAGCWLLIMFIIGMVFYALHWFMHTFFPS
jgi:hypothetical protein